MNETDQTRNEGTEIVRALRASRLINPEMSIGEIIEAAKMIPGLNDGSPLAWELITRDYVYKGSVAHSGASISDADISAIRKSGVLDLNTKLGDILTMAEKIPGIGRGGSDVAWELVSRDFVLRG